jgi:predicted RNase H-like nuclease
VLTLGVDVARGGWIAVALQDGVEARRVVGGRRSSVFFTPSRAALEATTYREARLIAPSTSAQGWALRTAILDVARVDDARVHEVHPEVSFAVLAGRPLAFSKRTWNGQHERRQLLAHAGIEIPDHLDAGLVPVDDVLDAAVAAWTAMRIARGEHVTIPHDPGEDEPVIYA